MKRATGFTLIELMVVIGLVVILAAIAIPAYRHMTSTNRVDGAVNALASTLSYARSEAIARGEQVAVCPRANATSDSPNCKTGDWVNGWLVFVDKDGDGNYDDATATPIRVHGAIGGATITDTPQTLYVAFNRMGFAQPTFSAGQTALTLLACPPDKRGAHARAVILYLSGAVKTVARRPDNGEPFSCP